MPACCIKRTGEERGGWKILSNTTYTQATRQHTIPTPHPTTCSQNCRDKNRKTTKLHRQTQTILGRKTTHNNLHQERQQQQTATATPTTTSSSSLLWREVVHDVHDGLVGEVSEARNARQSDVLHQPFAHRVVPVHLPFQQFRKVLQLQQPQ